jgi:hypothetical protein
MRTNVGCSDRILRIIPGIALLGTGIYFKSWWGLVGLAPLLSGIFRFCPGYWMFGLSTTGRAKARKPPPGAPAAP